MPRHEVASRRVLYEIPGMRSIRPRADQFKGADGHMLPLEVYEPPHPIAAAPPSVILLEGYPDAGFVHHVGCRFMEMEWTISMAQLIAASGMVAITHSNRDPGADAQALIDHLAAGGRKVGIWSTSGHGPVALWAARNVTCAVLINPVTKEFCPDTPLYIVRSGQDETPGLNIALDIFLHRAVGANKPLTLVNIPGAPHSFDLFHDAEITRHVLGQALGFLRVYLAA
jgi:hypothetical protein